MEERKNRVIISVSRQFGSGGHEVGNRLAERLDIPLYDHNLLRMAARELGVSDEDVAKVHEKILSELSEKLNANLRSN